VLTAVATFARAVTVVSPTRFSTLSSASLSETKSSDSASMKRHVWVGVQADVQKEKATHALALDATTRLMLYKLVNSGTIDEVHGCLSTGKESVVFHGTYRPQPDDPDCVPRECAIKVFKTVLTEFKNRQQFLQGDRRYEARVGRQGARKLVRMWAEKEQANLLRMAEAGLACPGVVTQRRHILVMTFLGDDGRDAPKLKVGLTPPFTSGVFASHPSTPSSPPQPGPNATGASSKRCVSCIMNAALCTAILANTTFSTGRSDPISLTSGRFGSCAICSHLPSVSCVRPHLVLLFIILVTTFRIDFPCPC
jgi:hypothetical protein